MSGIQDKGFVFLSDPGLPADPGIPGVQSMGPDVAHCIQHAFET